MNAGIDYGMGQTNLDTATGIRYGIHQANLVPPWALDDVIVSGKDLGYESFRKQVTEELQAAVTSVLSNYCLGEMGDVEAEDLYEMFAENLNDSYSMGESGPYAYEEDGLHVQLDEMHLWVFKSPYYTFARFCSPCLPGAGDLESPSDGGVKTYCLPPNWFDNEKPPYSVYRVDNDAEV